MFALYILEPTHGVAGIWNLSGHYGSRALLNAAVRSRRHAAREYGTTMEMRALPGRGVGASVQHADMPPGIKLPG